ncbi:class I SAM-dependent methyltransferase [Lentzea tibetensis]|uniref:Class I SAM-dependent methyltransferase n=1 Tax=Lentzea tibetensis TaxID=2591470 RepID=A0A563EIX7_9PSEU|nr:class I SAM-dependent methyltransferase [Lentzea tibetensis]TWP46508.1 class I SAM-dependent methyltransferase [Lentzea tibetensis]
MRGSTTAEVHGPRWGARAEARAELYAHMSMPVWELVARTVRAGSAVLDIGCGSGEFCRLAAARGAAVSGLDAAEAMVAIARRVVPGDFRVGAMESLPWEDETFDLVTGFNAFHMAADFGVALAEARRVTRVGGTVVLSNWTEVHRNDVLVLGKAVRPLQPPEWAPRPSPPVGEPGVLESLAVEAGLTVDSTGEIDVPWEAPDRRTLVRALLTAGSYYLAIEHSGEAAVAETLAEASEPFRRPDGSYRFENSYRYVVTTRR